MSNLKNNMIILSCLLVLIMFGSMYRVRDGYAIPAYPIIHTLTQPDGMTFSARQWGDEWMHGMETTDGYAIVQNLQGYWTYAVRDVSGWLTPTAFVVGRDDPVTLGIPQYLKPFFRLAGTPTKIQLVLLLNFADTTPVMTPNDFW